MSVIVSTAAPPLPSGPSSSSSDIGSSGIFRPSTPTLMADRSAASSVEAPATPSPARHKPSPLKIPDTNTTPLFSSYPVITPPVALQDPLDNLSSQSAANTNTRPQPLPTSPSAFSSNVPQSNSTTPVVIRRAAMNMGVANGPSLLPASHDCFSSNVFTNSEPQIIQNRRKSTEIERSDWFAHDPAPSRSWQCSSTLSSLGSLPPGAAPALNPAARREWELSSSAQYRVLSGKEDVTPFGIVPAKTQALRMSLGPTPELSSSCTFHSVESPAAATSSSNTSNLHNGFVYTAPEDANFTLHAVSNIAIGRPLVSPAITQSMSGEELGRPVDFFSSKSVARSDAGPDDDGEDLSGLTPVAHADPSQSSVEDSHSSASERPHSLSLDSPSLMDGQPSSASTSISNHSGVEDHSWSISQDKRWKRFQQRRYILLELIETEATYVCQLQDLIHVFFPIMASRGIFTMSQIASLGRNIQIILSIHEALLEDLIGLLTNPAIGLAHLFAGEDQLNAFAARLAEILLNRTSDLSIYHEFCAESARSTNLVRQAQQRPEWTVVESVCKSKMAERPRPSLFSILSSRSPGFKSDDLPPSTVSPSPSRLRLQDMLILPVQRICRYPMLLSAYLAGEYRLQSDSQIERAREILSQAASQADEAKKASQAAELTATVQSRIVDHPIITADFLRSLGNCELAGPIEFVYHHSVLSPLTSPAKVRYAAAFLFKGYLILAKVKRSTQYEVRHYLPLEMFEMVDLTTGFLPNSIRLSTAQSHHFDMAFVCLEEKAIWSTALLNAKDRSQRPPFDLPISVMLAAIRPRRDSLSSETKPSPKRHSVGPTTPTAAPTSAWLQNDRSTEERGSPSVPTSPITLQSGTWSSNMSFGNPSTILLRRASTAYKLTVDTFLSDVTSDTVSVARKSLPSLPSTLYDSNTSPTTLRSRLSLRDSNVVRRRRSFLSTSTGERASVVSTIGSTRNSFASSLKRGLSLASHQEFVDLADQSPSSTHVAEFGGSSHYVSGHQNESMDGTMMVSPRRGGPQRYSMGRRSSFLEFGTRSGDSHSHSEGQSDRPPTSRTNSIPSDGDGLESWIASGITTPSGLSEFGANSQGNGLDMSTLKASLAEIRSKESRAAAPPRSTLEVAPEPSQNTVTRKLSRTFSFVSRGRYGRDESSTSKADGRVRSGNRSEPASPYISRYALPSEGSEGIPLPARPRTSGGTTGDPQPVTRRASDLSNGSATSSTSSGPDHEPNRPPPLPRRKSLKFLAHLNPFTQISS